MFLEDNNYLFQIKRMDTLFHAAEKLFFCNSAKISSGLL